MTNRLGKVCPSFPVTNILCTYCLSRVSVGGLADSGLVEGHQGTGQQQQGLGRHLQRKGFICTYCFHTSI